MKTLKSILTLTFISLFSFAFTISDVTIKGWFKAGSLLESYKTGLDNNVFKNGQKSLFIESLDKNIEGFSTIMQSSSAKNYLGTKIKMTGYIKSENVEDWSGMWLRIDPKAGHESLGFDNMQNRPVKGTSDWTKCEIILDVPEESGTLNFGVLISGNGKIWFDNVSIEILDNKTPVAANENFTTQFPEKPVNLDFEE